MDRQRWIAAYRVVFGLLAVATIAFSFFVNRDTPGFTPAIFFGFFTVQSNLFAAALLLFLAGRPANSPPSPTLDLVRGAAVLYMATTGIVYGVLLVGYARELGTAVPWTNNVLHRVMPLVLVADWLIEPPQARLTLRQALIWLAYPAVFAVYSLVRGSVVGWYPYPFLNPHDVGGYGGVLLYCVGIFGLALLEIWAIVTVGNAQRALRDAHASLTHASLPAAQADTAGTPSASQPRTT